MLLWVDVILNLVVDRAGMRERIDLAFDGLERRWNGYDPAWFASEFGDVEWPAGHRLEVVQRIWNEADVEGELSAGKVKNGDLPGLPEEKRDAAGGSGG